MQPDIDYRLKPSPEVQHTWWVTSLALWLISSPLFIWLILPVIDPQSSIVVLSGYWAALWMMLPSLAAGLLAAIFRHRTASIGRVFRPTRARLLGALGLWSVLPVLSFGIFIFSAGYIGMTSLINFRLGLTGDAGLASLSFGMLGICYVIACLLSHGLPRLGTRIAAYSLMWFGALSLAAAAGALRIMVI